MFTIVFRGLVVWLVVNLIWSVLELKNKEAMRGLGFFNLAAVLFGLLMFVTLKRDVGVERWFLDLNVYNLVLAGVQLVRGYWGFE